MVHADSMTSTVDLSGKSFAYLMYSKGHAEWLLTLQNLGVTAHYSTQATDGATNALKNNDTLTVNQKINLSVTPGDISWFGTGISIDTPYGTWGDPATDPTKGCNTNDFVSNENSWWRYVPLVVKPPTPSISTSGNVTCGSISTNGSAVCTINSAGPVTITLQENNTYGVWYYHYNRGSGYCSISTQPLRLVLTAGIPCTVEDHTYQVQIPAASYTYTFSAINPIPTESITAPTIIGPTSATSGVDNTFTISGATDSTSNFHYEILWSDGGGASMILPQTGDANPYNNRNATVTTDRIFAFIHGGTNGYTLKARAVSNTGVISSWSSPLTITVTAPCTARSLSCVQQSDGLHLRTQDDACAIVTATDPCSYGCNGTATACNPLPPPNPPIASIAAGSCVGGIQLGANITSASNNYSANYPMTLHLDWGDGTPSVQISGAQGNNIQYTKSHTYPISTNNATYPLTVSATEEGGLKRSSSTAVYNTTGLYCSATPSPSITISAPTWVRAGVPFEVAWSVQNTTGTCTLTGSDSSAHTFDATTNPDSVPYSGTQTMVPISTATTFRLQCQGINGTTAVSTPAKVRVVPSFQEI